MSCFQVTRMPDALVRLVHPGCPSVSSGSMLRYMSRSHSSGRIPAPLSCRQDVSTSSARLF
ncbi:hypothetical protein HPB50_002544 [Hyalomma asiaticum]|uniref:Uncharacterized protein n=1 Tax=Hyalomma asiaticum TaxID=266040 RepID=A0ACB7SYA6_HYAAI|nr:hypothetical protein HPB50_002544 [Hyalomma asiaticum]